MPVQQLPPIAIEGHKSSGLGTPDHPMRIATRRAAGLDADGWTSELREDVEQFFDDLAPEWNSRDTTQRVVVVRDALERGLDPLMSNGTRGSELEVRQVAVEVGSGTGTYSPLLAERFANVVAVDLSHAMLKFAPASPGHRVQADGAQLPLRDGAADAVVLINAFLFPSEVTRVLSHRGVLVWVNSSGEKTPIHLSVDDLLARLPGGWNGVASRAGEGLWCVLRRTTAHS